MINQETAGFNPRTGNGSAYDLMNLYGQQAGIPSGIPSQQQSYYQTPLAAQQKPAWQQQAWQQPWQQLGQQPPWQQQQAFSQPPGFNQQFQQQPYQGVQTQPYFNPQFQQQPFFGAHQQPFASPWQNVGMQSPFAAFGVQPQTQLPVVTHRAAELKITVPVHRLLGKHPVEVQQYFQHVVLPVLLDGLIKRTLTNDLGLSISTDLRGECVAEIDI